MKHPPYHLRVNKAIDRFLLIEILDILKNIVTYPIIHTTVLEGLF